MKTFQFIQKNGSAIITLSADNLENAQKDINELVASPEAFRVEDEDGEDEDSEWF